SLTPLRFASYSSCDPPPPGGRPAPLAVARAERACFIRENGIMANALPSRPASPNGASGVPHLATPVEEPSKNGGTTLKGRYLSHGLAYRETSTAVREEGSEGEAMNGAQTDSPSGPDHLQAENAE